MIIHTGLHGHFDLCTRRKAGRKSKRLRPGRRAGFDNLITDYGLNQFAASGSVLNACYVGTGNTPPANSDTRLVAPVGTTTSTTGAAQVTRGGSPQFWTQNSTTFRFAAGAATGNLSEVGVGSGPLPSYNLFSRALIVDGSSNPTTFPVLPDEVLDVTYSLRMYPKVTDTTFTFVVNSVTYTGTIRPSHVALWNLNYSGMVALQISLFANVDLNADLAGSIIGTSLTAGTVALQAYVQNTFYRDSINTWTPAQGNHANGTNGASIGHVKGQNMFCLWQCQWTPAIPKDANKTMTLTVRQSWGRYAP